MAKQALLSLLLLVILGQIDIHAQDSSLPDSLKVKLRQEENIKPDFEVLPAPIFPAMGIGNEFYFNSFSPAYIDTRSWGMQFHDPVLPWGLQGSSVYQNDIGLGASRSATIQKDLNYGRFTFSAYSSIQKHSGKSARA